MTTETTGQLRSFWINADDTRGWECDCGTTYDWIAPDEMPGIRAQHVCTVEHREGVLDYAAAEVDVDADEPRCPSCGQPQALLTAGLVGHSDPVCIERVEYTAGLRALADLLDAHPELRLPYDGRTGPIAVYLTTQDGADQRANLAAWARVLPGPKTKEQAGTDGQLFALRARLHGLNFEVIANRDEVCERVVVGTREVVETVPDPELLAAVPTVEQTRTEELVEWRCGAVLAERPEGGRPS